MNEFEELCRLASNENWCWKLICTTCGHTHFRYAFSELASGRSPASPTWIVHALNTSYLKTLGPLPRSYTEVQKEAVNNICSKANLSSIAELCKFPDWLGYLGLLLEHMYSGAESYKELSESWAEQLVGLVSDGSIISKRLSEIANGNGVLNIKDLEACELDIMHNNRLQKTSALSRRRPPEPRR